MKLLTISIRQDWKEESLLFSEQYQSRTHQQWLLVNTTLAVTQCMLGPTTENILLRLLTATLETHGHLFLHTIKLSLLVMTMQYTKHLDKPFLATSITHGYMSTMILTKSSQVQQLHTLEITIAQLGVPPLLIAMALGMTLPLPVIRTHGVTATKTQLKEADLAAELALESLAYFLSNI